MNIPEELQAAMDHLNAMADMYAEDMKPDTWHSGLVFGLREGAKAIAGVLEGQK